VPFDAILTGKVARPIGSGALETAVRKYANQAAADHGEMKTSRENEWASR
jgi:hypothetical protein